LIGALIHSRTDCDQMVLHPCVKIQKFHAGMESMKYFRTWVSSPSTVRSKVSNMEAELAKFFRTTQIGSANSQALYELVGEV